jgi:5-methylcytosine-specific restriction endonuclease McrA
MVKNPIPWKVRFRERYLESKRRHYLKHKKKILAHQKRYVKKNIKRVKAYRDKYWAEHREEKNKYDKARQNLPHIRERKKQHRKAWLKRNPDSSSKWRKSHPKEMSVFRKRWAKNNPEKLRHYCLQRRAMKLGATFGDPKDILAYITKLKTDINTICYYCEAALFGTEFHIDHIVPLTRGGLHNLNNLCAACPSCNVRKRARLLDEFGESTRSRIAVETL